MNGFSAASLLPPRNTLASRSARRWAHLPLQVRPLNHVVVDHPDGPTPLPSRYNAPETPAPQRPTSTRAAFSRLCPGPPISRSMMWRHSGPARLAKHPDGGTAAGSAPPPPQGPHPFAINGAIRPNRPNTIQNFSISLSFRPNQEFWAIQCPPADQPSIARLRGISKPCHQRNDEKPKGEERVMTIKKPRNDPKYSARPSPVDPNPPSRAPYRPAPDHREPPCTTGAPRPAPPGRHAGSCKAPAQG